MEDCWQFKTTSNDENLKLGLGVSSWEFYANHAHDWCAPRHVIAPVGYPNWPLSKISTACGLFILSAGFRLNTRWNGIPVLCGSLEMRHKKQKLAVVLGCSHMREVTKFSNLTKLKTKKKKTKTKQKKKTDRNWELYFVLRKNQVSFSLCYGLSRQLHNESSFKGK